MKPSPGAGPSPPGGPRPAAQVPLSGELKKDPVCGTYISTATSVKEKVGGEVFHFCSAQCRDKYVASSVH
jgi:YHS domain-containing protein